MSAAIKTYNLTRSQLAAAAIRWEGKPLTLDAHPMFRAPYDEMHKRVVMKTSRQVGKSIMLMVMLLTDSIGQKFFKTLFVTPQEELTQRFSSLRLHKAIQFSPFIKQLFIDSSLPNRVLTRSFTTGSEIILTYACEDGDRVRGNSADHIALDEVQDIVLTAVAPEITECLRASKIRRESYCGTPKSLENGLEGKWQASTQTEWAIKCDGCNKYSIIVSETQIGKKGPICGHCGKYLNPRNGVWVDTNRKPDMPYKGFHISRPMMVGSVPAAWTEGTKEWEEAVDAWKDVLATMEGPTAYSLPQFRNEVLGMSDSVGQRMITEADLWACATYDKFLEHPSREDLEDILRIGVGIDWSGGGGNGHSFTVVSVVGRTRKGKLRVLFFRIFPGLHAVAENKEIADLIRRFDGFTPGQCVVGADAGNGNTNVDMLRTSLDNPGRIQKFEYNGQMSYYLTWDPKAAKFLLKRTPAIDAFMLAVLRKDFEFPKEPRSLVEAGFKHILAEYEEVVTSQSGERKIWQHAETAPDDFLHSLVYARTVLLMSTGELPFNTLPP